MGEHSKIEWCDHTFNPWIGCQKVGPGCDNCYAEAINYRFGWGHWGPHAERRITSDANWKAPERWNRQAALSFNGWRAGVEALYGGNEQAALTAGFIKPRRPRVFCASMADVFDNAVPQSVRNRLWQLIERTIFLDWILVTKRIRNVAPMVPAWWGHPSDVNPTLLVTICNQREANHNIPILLNLKSTFGLTVGISAEPLLGPIDLTPWARDLDWVIAGGETGPNARPTHLDWVRSLRDQCAMADTAFFFKGHGSWRTIYDRDLDDPAWRQCPSAKNSNERYLNLAGGHGFHGERVIFIRRVGKKRSGRLLDGVEHNSFPKVAA